MAHNTLSGGAVTEIGGGRAALNGAVYEVDSGKAMGGGTVYPISFAEPIDVPALSDATWEQIREVSDAGLAANYWAVGDRKAITLNGTVGRFTFNNETYYAYIIGINHNSGKEGANRIHFQFGYNALSDNNSVTFVDSANNTVASSDCFHMNSDKSNIGGWSSCYARETLCPQFKEAMPSDLQAVLKTVTKYTDNAGDKNTSGDFITATTDTIFLLAEWEIFGKRTYANTSEKNHQMQYDYYSAGNSKIKYNHSNNTLKRAWWLRSADTKYNSYFCCVNTSGGAGSFSSDRSLGFSPAFCV